MRPEEVTPLQGTELWEAFKTRFIYDRGIPLLGLGQTESGKTEKSYQIGKYLIDAGETWIRFDCGKPHEILPLLSMGKPVKIISPPDCEVDIHIAEDSDYQPGPFELWNEIAVSPEDTWNHIEKGVINIVSYRAFFLDGTSFGSYLARSMNALMNQVCSGDSPIPTPSFLDIDEFSEVCPAYGLIENRHQKEAASRIARVIKKLRGMGIRLVAYDQSWTDVYPNARRAFPWLLVCRSPGLSGRDIPSLERFAGLFESLAVNEALLIWPNRKWVGFWEFNLLPRPKGVTIKYRGQCYIAKAKRKRETWIREMDDEAEEVEV